MRGCVFLTVLLILVLSLGAGNTTTSPNTTNSSTPTAPPSPGGNTTTSPNTMTNTSMPTAPPSPGNTTTSSNTTTNSSMPTAPPSPGNTTTSPNTTTNTSMPTAPPSPGNTTTSPNTTTNSSMPTAPPSPGGNTTTSPNTTTNTSSPTSPPSPGNTTTSPNTTTNSSTPTAPPSPGGNPTTSPNTTTNTSSPTAPPSPGNTTTSPNTTTNSSTPTAPPSPGGNTTTSPNTTTNTSSPTSPPSPGNTTTSPNTTTNSSTPTAPPSPGNPTTSPNTTTNSSTPTAPPSPGDICSSRPCGTNMAKCIALHSIYTCQCPYGFYYKDKVCHKGQIFPGLITLEWTYNSTVELISSVLYENVFLKVTTFFEGVFKNETSFGQTVIVEIEEIRKALRRRRSVDNPMNITLMNIFAENSTLTEENVTNAITAANNPDISAYRGTTYCAVFQCDLRTTECKEDAYPVCECLESYEKTPWDDRSCSDCRDCSAANNKFCAKEGGVPTCKCLDNYEKKGDQCVPCAVGYSGENCKNNSKLILIIVGTVLGAIILCFVIAITVISTRSKHKRDPERKSLIKSGNLNSEDSGITQPRMFPRVQTTSGHANPGYQPNHPYENPYSSRSNAVERDYDDEFEIAKEPDGFRLQRRY